MRPHLRNRSQRMLQVGESRKFSKEKQHFFAHSCVISLLSLCLILWKGNRHLTVFNEQSTVHVGGRWNPRTGRVERGLVGVVAGALFNGLRPLDRARDGDPAARVDGSARSGNFWRKKWDKKRLKPKKLSRSLAPHPLSTSPQKQNPVYIPYISYVP